MSKGQVEKILYEVGHSLQEKLINTTLYAPSEFTDDIDIPTEFFEEVFKKHEFDPEDFELEEFIRDYYVAVKDFVIEPISYVVESDTSFPSLSRSLVPDAKITSSSVATMRDPERSVS